jgi:glycosyltransferase involved in cell wall biosynthesis
MVGPSNQSDLTSIQEEADRMGISDYVVIREQVASNEIPSIIAGADICLCPLQDIEKYRWSYPVKIYEYMAMSKPIVASNLPGTACLITHQSVGGCLCDADDYHQFKLAILWLIENPQKSSLIAAAGCVLSQSKNWNHHVSKIAKDLDKRLMENIR